MALISSIPVRGAAEEIAFRDVPDTHWAASEIAEAARLGLVSGTDDGVFGFGRAVTCAEYSVMLCRLMDWEMLDPEQGSFADNQDRGAWYYSAIETAYANGALLKLNETCQPQRALTREEMVTMTVRALGYTALAGIVHDDCPFTDVTTNRGYFAIAYRMGLTGGTDNTIFSPRDISTREQAAVVLLRTCHRLNAPFEVAPLKDGDAAYVAVEPVQNMDGQLPLCPLAPMEDVYYAAIEAGEGGAVLLQTLPYAIEVGALAGGRVTQERLRQILSDSGTQSYHSERYDSSYLVWQIEGSLPMVVWYESEEDLAAKAALCRNMGLRALYLQ